MVLRKLNPGHLMQVLTKAAMLAYERPHVAKGIVEGKWNDQNNPNYTSRLVAAWCFDVIRSGETLFSACHTEQMRET